MGFTWTEISIGDEITAAVIAEMRTNLNTLYGNLDLAAWIWSNIPVQDKIIPATQYTEFKDVTDNADDQNYCRTHYATHDSSYNVTHDTTLYADHDTTHLNDHNTGHNSGQDSSINSNNLSGYNGTNLSFDYAPNYQFVNGGHNTSHYNGHNIEITILPD